MISTQFYKSVCYVIALLAPVSLGATTNFTADPDFWNYHLTLPKVHHAVHKRRVYTSREEEDGGKHSEGLFIDINLHGVHRILDLKLNRNLMSSEYFEKHQTDSGYVTRRPAAKDVDLCHYHGTIRDVPNSWVAVSTCYGVRGMLFDGEQLFYIERASNSNSSSPFDDVHVVYKHSDLKSNFTCGFHGDSSHATIHDHSTDAKNRRVRRSTNVLHGPYNSNKLSRYIELVIVIDTKEYSAFNEDMHRVHQHTKDIANIINSLYVPLNIFVALVGVVIWTKYDEINLEVNGDKTLTSFLTYRKEKLVKEHPNDNAQLLTRIQFENGVVGKALKGPICTYEFSGGVNMDHSNVIGLVATTVAHEMGHNLGMEHDTENDCKCPGERCIMSPSSSSYSPTEWSSCSREYLAVAFEHGMDYCLRNKPTSLFDGPVCGNDFVEPGEECDCGLKEKCDNPCCNASTCMLHPNATCATGECCDLQTCKPRTAGMQCRNAEHECDLPEYCTGLSEYCPDDVFKIDGESCDEGKAYCYRGNCRTHSDQCEILWGPSGVNSDLACYNMNTKGNRHGNCGYNRLNQSYVKCETQDIFCGMLQCKHCNEKLEFGMESVAILSHSFITGANGTTIIPCRTVIVDLGLNEIDPGLTPDGAKCAENHMCYRQRCMPINSLRAITAPNACPDNCNGNGVCNSRGHCHCDKGYAPPSCDYSGVGGSEDSGPAENPHNLRWLRTLSYYSMLTIVLVVLILAGYSYYVRKSPSYFWKRNQRRTIQKSVQVHANHDDRHNGGLGSTVQSLLSNTTRSAGGKANDETTSSSLHDTLIGSFKGFSIMPLLNNNKTNEAQPVKAAAATTASLPVRPAPPPVHSIPVATVRPMTTGRIPSGSGDASPVSSSSASTPSNACRPLISSPVLDKTTSITVNQLINKNLPVRPAPPVPLAAAAATATTTTTTTKPERPSSMSCVLEEMQKSALSDARRPLSPRESSSTLNRIASFVSKSQSATGRSEGGGGGKREGVPLKAAKIDKDTLKNLVISDPIPLSEPSIPVNPLPLSKDQQKCVVLRAHSLRQTGHKQRPGIPSFGSVRLSQAQRRSSISSSFSRPTSPPPCPPPAPGANLSNAYTAESEDNIYAIIEESPVDEAPPKSVLDSSSSSSPPKRPGIMEGGDGLLNEIVNEMKARNIDSIYANEVIGCGSNDHDRVYANTAPLADSNKVSSSSEYLKPRTSEELKTVENKSYPSPLKVPDVSAPSYKPFNSMYKKPSTSIALTHGKSASQCSAAAAAASKEEGGGGQSNAKLSSCANELKSSQAESSVETSAEVEKSSSASSASKSSTIKPAPLTAKPVIKPNLLPKSKIVPQKVETGPGKSFAGIPKTSMVASMQRRFEAARPPPGGADGSGDSSR